MILKVLVLGSTVFFLSACVNDGELFEDDVNVGSDGLFADPSDSTTNPTTGGNPQVNPDDVPVVIADGETTGVLEVDENLVDVGGGSTGGDTGLGVEAGDTGLAGDGMGEQGSDPNNPQLTDAQIDATSGLFLLPADCELATGTDGRKYCFSRLNGENIYATTANDRLLWSYNFAADDGFTFDSLLVDDSLFVLSRASDDSGVWNIVSFSTTGEELFNVQVLGGALELDQALLTVSGIYVVANRGEGNGYQVSRIDRETGTLAADLRFPEAVVESLTFEESVDGDRMVLGVDGRRRYYEPLTFEPIIIIYALDASNYQLNFPQMMSGLRADYIADFIQALRNTSSFLASGVTPLESDGSIYSCGVSGTVELLAENNTVNAMTFTQAYQYIDCVMSSQTLNGQVVYSTIGIDSASGASGTEILTFENMQLSESSTGDLELDENSTTPVAAIRSLSASMTNIWSQRNDEFSSEKVFATASYSDSRPDTATTISNATYNRTLAGTGSVEQASNIVLSESGTSEVSASYTGGIDTTLRIEPEFSYGDQSLLLVDGMFSSAPRSGVLLAEAADGSSLRVEASGEVLLYTIDTQAAESSFEDGWAVAPLNADLRF